MSPSAAHRKGLLHSNLLVLNSQCIMSDKDAENESMSAEASIGRANVQPAGRHEAGSNWRGAGDASSALRDARQTAADAAHHHTDRGRLCATGCAVLGSWTVIARCANRLVGKTEKDEFGHRRMIGNEELTSVQDGRTLHPGWVLQRHRTSGCSHRYCSSPGTGPPSHWSSLCSTRPG